MCRCWMRNDGRRRVVKVKRKVHADGPRTVYVVQKRARVHGDEDGVSQVNEEGDGKFK